MPGMAGWRPSSPYPGSVSLSPCPLTRLTEVGGDDDLSTLALTHSGHGDVHSLDDLSSVQLENEGGVAGEGRVDEGTVLQVEHVLLVDGVAALGLLALRLGDDVCLLDGDALLGLPLLSGHSAEEVDQLDGIVQDLVLLDAVTEGDNS